MTRRASEKQRSVADYYDRAAANVPAFTVLNYGFHSDAEPSIVPPAHPEHYCLRLYEHAVRATDLVGKRVLEVSCGRGGGASFLFAQHGVARYVGIDASRENIRFAQARDAGPEFLLGEAHALDFPDRSFDVVINIEASHLYDDRKTFFAEVRRVLAPGGAFCYADGCWANDDCSQDLLDAGFEILERREITDNVIAALERDSARRAAIFEAMAATDLVEEYKDWGGVVGYRAYRRFAERQTLYFSHRLRRPA